jgi:hypothetical protein
VLSSAKYVAPLEQLGKSRRALKVRNKFYGQDDMPLFQSWSLGFPFFQGRRASLRSALAPGYYVAAPLALKHQSIPQIHLVAL